MLSLYKIKHLLRKIHGEKLFLEFADENVSQFDALFDDTPETMAKYRYQQKRIADLRPKSKPKKPEYLKPIKNNSLTKRIMSDSKRQNASVSMTPAQRAFVAQDTTFSGNQTEIWDSAAISNNTFKEWVNSGFKTLTPEKFFALFMSGIHKNGKLVYILGTGSGAIRGDSGYDKIEVTSGNKTAAKISFKYRPWHSESDTKSMKPRNAIENTFVIRPDMIDFALALPKLANYAFYIRLKDTVGKSYSELKDIYLVLAPKNAGIEYRDNTVVKAVSDIAYMVVDMMEYFRKANVIPSIRFANIFTTFKRNILQAAPLYHNGYPLGISNREYTDFFNKYAEKLPVEKLNWNVARALSGWFVKEAKRKSALNAQYNRRYKK